LQARRKKKKKRLQFSKFIGLYEGRNLRIFTSLRTYYINRGGARNIFKYHGHFPEYDASGR